MILDRRLAFAREACPSAASPHHPLRPPRQPLHHLAPMIALAASMFRLLNKGLTTASSRFAPIARAAAWNCIDLGSEPRILKYRKKKQSVASASVQCKSWLGLAACKA